MDKKINAKVKIFYGSHIEKLEEEINTFIARETTGVYNLETNLVSLSSGSVKIVITIYYTNTGV